MNPQYSIGSPLKVGTSLAEAVSRQVCSLVVTEVTVASWNSAGFEQLATFQETCQAGHNPLLQVPL